LGIEFLDPDGFFWLGWGGGGVLGVNLSEEWRRLRVDSRLVYT